MAACPACRPAALPLTLAEFNELHVREGRLLEDLVRNLDLKESLTEGLARPGVTLRQTILACDGIKTLAEARRSIERELGEIHADKCRRIGSGD